MHKEDVEHTEYKDDLVRQTNTDHRYDYLFTTNKPVQPASLGIVVFLLRCQNKITEKNFTIAFSLLVPIMIMRTLKTWDSRMHIPFNFLFITISMYISTTKVKVRGENSVYKDQKLLKNLNSSN